MADPDAGDGACLFCKSGPVVRRTEEIQFRQWSDKGYVHCRATIPVDLCAHCGSRSLAPDSAEAIDHAFRVEYDKLT